MNHTLLNSQKADIFYLITQNNMSPPEFQWMAPIGVSNSHWVVSAIRHAPSGHYLTFDRITNSFESFEISYPSPNHGKVVAKLHGTPGPNTRHISCQFPLEDWENQLGFTGLWLKALRKEVLTPDPWGMLDTAKEFLDSMTVRGLENTPFTENEKIKISDQLDKIKRFFQQKYSEDRKKLEHIENSIKHLVNSSQTMGRKDWSMTAMSLLMTLGAGFYFAVSPTDFSILSEYASLVKNLFSFLSTITPPLIQ